MTFFSQVKKSRDEDYIERREGELESLDKIEIAEDLSVEEEDEDLLCYENIEEIEGYLNAKEIEKENNNLGCKEGLQSLEKASNGDKDELECNESFEDIEKVVMTQ